MATSFYQVKNNAKTTITNNPLTAGGLSITLASSTGSKFPTTGNTWLGTIWDAVTYSDPSDDPNMEIVLIDSRSTDTLTVNASGRGFAGTTGVSHATGSAFRLLFTKEHADQWNTAINTLEVASVGTYVLPTAWTPTRTVSGGTVPTYTAEDQSRYTQVGKTVKGWISWINTSGGTAGAGANVVEFTLPVTAANIGTALLGYSITIGSGVYSNGAGVGAINVALTTTGKACFYGVTGTGVLGSDQNNTARGIRAFFEYEAA